jgi:hypothetical protein
MGKWPSTRNFFPFFPPFGPKNRTVSLKAFSVYGSLLTSLRPPKTFNPHILVGQRKTNLSVAASMSAECESLFSSTKKPITPERNRPAEEIIEASECLKNWWDRGLIQQLEEEEAI